MHFEYFNITKLSDQFKIILLFCLVLVIYLPGLNSGFFIFDDYGLVNGLKGIPLRDAGGFFGHAGGRYWRPLIGISYLFDVSLLNANSTWMHLHSLLLHSINTILVFLIARLLISSEEKSSLWPFLAAVLFAVHPVNTEAVNWISGRTDILACCFTLSGVYLFLVSFKTRVFLLPWASALLLLFGSMAKEVAFSMFPAIILSLLIVKHWESLGGGSLSFHESAARGAPYLIGASTYLWLRWQAFTTFDQGVGKVIDGSSADGVLLVKHTHNALIALGFYIKKLFMPAPLNFAIDHVNPMYFWLGLLTLLAALLLAIKRNHELTLILFLLFAIAPAMLNALFHIAWTPYAERYLYLPSAFLCTIVVTFGGSTRASNNIRIMLVPFLFLCFLFLTGHRNLQWMQPELVLADAIRQNPDNLILRINNALVLANIEGAKRGREELHRVLSLEPDNQAARRNLAMIALEIENMPNRARKDLTPFFCGEQEPEEATLLSMIKVNRKRLEQAPVDERDTIDQELFLSYRKYYLLSGNPTYLFAAAEKTRTLEDWEFIRGLLASLTNNPAVSGKERSKAGELLTALQNNRFN